MLSMVTGVSAGLSSDCPRTTKACASSSLSHVAKPTPLPSSLCVHVPERNPLAALTVGTTNSRSCCSASLIRAGSIVTWATIACMGVPFAEIRSCTTRLARVVQGGLARSGQQYQPFRCHVQVSGERAVTGRATGVGAVGEPPVARLVTASVNTVKATHSATTRAAMTPGCERFGAWEIALILPPSAGAVALHDAFGEGCIRKKSKSVAGDTVLR